MKFEIKSRWSGSVLFEVEAGSLKLAVEAAVKSGAYLRDAYLSGANLSGANLRDANLSGANLRDAYLSGANLRGANLSGAYLRDAYLSGANLRDAYLSGANLRDANLRGANLSGANLRDAYLRDANLRDANLRGANLSGANLRDAYLSGANLSWQSHALLGQILFLAAGDNVEKRMVAGLIAISEDWCWDEFLRIEHSQKEWALTELAKWVRDDDGAPNVLRKLAKQQGDTAEASK